MSNPDPDLNEDGPALVAEEEAIRDAEAAPSGAIEKEQR